MSSPALPTLDALASLVGAARAMAVTVDPAGLDDAGLARAQRLWADLADVATAAGIVNLKAADGREVWRSAGAANPTQWLQHTCRIAAGRAKMAVHLANAYDEMPAAAEAHTAGDISTSQRELLSLAQSAAPEQYRRDESTLLDKARELSLVDFKEEVAEWCDAHRHPDDAAMRAESQYQQRSLSLSETFKGMWYLSGWLHPELGELVKTGLEAAMPAPTADDTRTPRQRRADAMGDLVQMCLRTGDLPTSGGVPAQITLVADVAALDPELEGPASVRAAWTGRWWKGSLERALCHASVRRLVLDGKSAIVDVGEATHVIPTALYRAVVARDRRCCWPGCDRQTKWCHAHHLIPVARGGHTNGTNLALFCSLHHRMLHEGGWQATVTITHDGERIVSITPPGHSPP